MDTQPFVLFVPPCCLHILGSVIHTLVPWTLQCSCNFHRAHFFKTQQPKLQEGTALRQKSVLSCGRQVIASYVIMWQLFGRPDIRQCKSQIIDSERLTTITPTTRNRGHGSGRSGSICYIWSSTQIIHFQTIFSYFIIRNSLHIEPNVNI
jgi:hypothetical protein